jgi:curli biogenesis system outer membrane secretion channel CsgG
MHRDLQLRIKVHLYEIAEVNDDVIESRQGFTAAEGGYQNPLESVADVAVRDLVDDVAEYIKEYIQKKEIRPENNSVRKKARSVVSRARNSPDPYLNAT